MKTYRIATIPGDGIGKEVVPAGQQVLEALAEPTTAFRFEFENFDWGGDYFREHGVMMPDDGLDAIRDKDAILFGSAGDPAHPRPHHAVGPAPEDLPGLRPIRQRPSDAHPARHRRPAEALRAGRSQLGHRARELRRRILGRRRPRASGPSDRSRDRRVDDDPRRRRAHHALRVQARAVASAQAADRHHQEQRPAPRDGDVGRDRAADLEGVPGRHVGQGTRRCLRPRA